MILADLENIPESDLIDILVAATPVAYIILDKEYRVHFINDYFLELRKLEKEKVLGEKCYNLSNKGVRCEVCAVGKAIATGARSRVLRKDILENGLIRYIDDYAIPLYMEDSDEFDYILEIMVNRDKEMKLRRQKDDDFKEIIQVLSMLLEEKDTYTANHSRNVRSISIQLAEALNLSEDEILDIDIAASLHDIGKVYISSEIINKPSELSEQEYNIIKSHPSKSREIINKLSGFQNAKRIVESHHERYDGKGYPKGLSGNRIPMGSRIIAVADTYDAMTSTRSYRNALTHEIAIEEIRRNSGTQFDPFVVETFLRFFGNKDVIDVNIPELKKSFYEGHERKIEAIEPESQENENKNFKELHDIITEKQLIHALFNNTPVAYIIMDEEHNIIYSNDYFYEIIGETKDNFKVTKCTDFNKDNKQCSYCIFSKVMNSNELVEGFVRRDVKSGEKYFYVFAVPVISKGKKYIVEILIDHTQEYILRKQHEKDLYNVVSVLSSFVMEQRGDDAYKNLTSLSTQIGIKMEVSEEELHQIEVASNLCDLGMIAMENDGKNYTKEEIEELHPLISLEILSKLSGFDKVKEIILHHHDHYEKGNVLDGKKGNKIPLGSRIIAVASILFDNEILDINNMTQQQMSLLKMKSDHQLDPHIIECVCK